MAFDWDDDKNELLKETRNISFEQIVQAIDAGALLDVLRHPNQKVYPNQHVYVVEINHYVYIVPFVRDVAADRVFLKTIYPSRKYTRRYLCKENTDEQTPND